MAPATPLPEAALPSTPRGDAGAASAGDTTGGPYGEPPDFVLSYDGKRNGVYRKAGHLIRVATDAWMHQPANPQLRWGQPRQWPLRTTWVWREGRWTQTEYRVRWESMADAERVIRPAAERASLRW